MSCLTATFQQVLERYKLEKYLYVRTRVRLKCAIQLFKIALKLSISLYTHQRELGGVIEPFRMEKLTARLIHSLISVSAKEITLGLGEILGQAIAPIAVKII